MAVLRDEILSGRRSFGAWVQKFSTTSSAGPEKGTSTVDTSSTSMELAARRKQLKVRRVKIMVMFLLLFVTLSISLIGSDVRLDLSN